MLQKMVEKAVLPISQQKIDSLPSVQTMIHIMLDTNIFLQDPTRKKAPFQALTVLAKKNRLMLHIPYIVRNEFLGNIADQSIENLTQLDTVLAKLSKKNLQKSVHKAISSFQAKSTTFGAKAIAHLEEEFGKWAKEINAKVYPLKSRYAHFVFRKYFSGTPPFRGRRTKTDIPDAFIFADIKSIVKAHHPLNVLVADNRLRSACKTIKDVIAFSSLEEFIKSDQCQVLLKDHVFEEQIPTIKTLLLQHKISLQNELSNKLIDALAWKVQVKDSDIPSDDHSAYISLVGDAEQWKIDYDHLEYLGGGTLVLEFKCKVEVYLDYSIFKADYHMLSDDRSGYICISEYDNRHYYEAEETRTIEVEGAFSCTLDLSSVADGEDIVDNLDGLVDGADIEVEEINCVRLLPS